jgi:hypothetical protein
LTTPSEAVSLSFGIAEIFGGTRAASLQNVRSGKGRKLVLIASTLAIGGIAMNAVTSMDRGQRARRRGCFRRREAML